MYDTDKYSGKICSRTLQTLVLYGKSHVPTGGFLKCVLSNDLSGSVGRADERNLESLPDIVKFIYNEMPTGSHGSEAAVKTWIKGGKTHDTY